MRRVGRGDRGRLGGVATGGRGARGLAGDRDGLQLLTARRDKRPMRGWRRARTRWVMWTEERRVPAEVGERRPSTRRARPARRAAARRWTEERLRMEARQWVVA